MAQIQMDRTSPRARMTAAILAVLAGTIAVTVIWQKTQIDTETPSSSAQALAPTTSAATTLFARRGDFAFDSVGVDAAAQH